MAVRFISTELKTEPGERGMSYFEIHREIDQPDGTVVHDAWLLPYDTLTIRAGEYGLDPVADSDAVWDMLLAESLQGHEDPDPPLFTAPDVATARREHLATCRARLEQHAGRAPRQNAAMKQRADGAHDAAWAKLRRLALADTELAELVGRRTAIARAHVERGRAREPRSLKAEIRHELAQAEQELTRRGQR